MLTKIQSDATVCRYLFTAKSLFAVNACRKLFIELKILTFPSLYIYQLIMFVNKNSELYITNDSIHNYNTRLKKIYINQLLILLNIKMECYVKN